MLQVLTEADGLVSLILACMLGGVAVLATGPDFSWMVEAIFIGYFLHLVGDVVTTEGIPPFWPISFQFKIPILGSTDHWRERSAGIACGIVAFYLAITVVFLPGWRKENEAAREFTMPNKGLSIEGQATGSESKAKSSAPKNK